MSKKSEAPPIIKKIKKTGHHAHHGGSWKIAYADFVTAMMTFFLLMWLLNSTSEEQRRGIANYFDPFAGQVKGGGNMGVMGGSSVKESEGSLSDSTNRIHLRPATPSERGAGGQAAGMSRNPDHIARDNGGLTESDKEKLQAKKEIEDKLLQQVFQERGYKSKEQEEKAFKDISEDIKKKIEENPEIQKLGENLRVEMTPEGLRISVVDQVKTAMFPSGSSRMYKQMEEILKVIAKAIEKAPNKIAVAGHTDGNQYSSNSIFSNWELSAERANASRRILSQNGIDDGRFEVVEGRADRDLLNKEEPKDPQNRRVTITLLRMVKKGTEKVTKN